MPYMIKKTILIILSLILLAATACQKEEKQEYKGQPAIKMSLLSWDDRSVTVSFETLFCDAVYCMAQDTLIPVPSAEEIIRNGVKAENDIAEISGLDADSPYKVYGVGVLGTEYGSIESIGFVTDEPAPDLYDWEKNRDGFPDMADLMLIPGGYSGKMPFTWNKERIFPFVSYTDEDGKEHWLHEAFLFIGGYDARRGLHLCITPDGKSGTKDSWVDFLNYWFMEEGGVVPVLDEVIGEVKERIGDMGHKHYVVMTMPDPVMFEFFGDKNSSTTYWGEIDGRIMDFSKLEDQIDAYKWFINRIRERWAEAAPENLELVGYYVLSEELVDSPSGWNYQYKRWDRILPEVSKFIHTLNSGMYWIPYYMADGYDNSDGLGIDVTYMQPNKYWDYDRTKSWGDIADAIRKYGLGMELEFEGTHGEGLNPCSSILEKLSNGKKNEMAATNKQLFRDYLDFFKREGFYGKVPLAIYSGTNAMYELANSTEPEDVALYHEYCRFIIDSPLR